MIASSAAAARQLKRRPASDRIVAVRDLQPGEGGGSGPKTQRWSRLRRDGKPPESSAYGKGRGQGPPRSGSSR